jgi:hypothetical protein
MYSISKIKDLIIIKPAPLVNSCGAKTIIMNIMEVIAVVTRTADFQIIDYSPENLKAAKQGYKLHRISIRRCNQHGQHLTAGEYIKISPAPDKVRKKLNPAQRALIRYIGSGATVSFLESEAHLAARYARSIGRFAYRVSSVSSGVSLLIQDSKR